MLCPFCGWEAALLSVDPAEIVVAFDDHLDGHVHEMVREARVA